MEERQERYRWGILTLIVLTVMIVVAIPSMAISVLSKEISLSLGLNVVQVGLVWGIGFLPGIATNLLGGVLGDLLGPKRVLVVSVLLGGLASAARGLAGDFPVLLVMVVLQGLTAPVIMMNAIKMASMWFLSRQLGIANGAISIGMALGFLLGSFFSASVLSPLLGGWRNVLIVYGLVGALLAIPWALVRTPPVNAQAGSAATSLGQAVRHVAGIPDIWLLGLALFGFAGAVQSMLGYLPLYLRNLGWPPLTADTALSMFHTLSLIFVFPIAFLSDRIHSRKGLLLLSVMFAALGTGLLSVARGGWIWAAVALAGFVRDGAMTLFTTMAVETDNVGPTYAGTAVGFAMAISAVGQLVAPPLGNSLANYHPGAPFAFWSLLTLLGMVCLALTRRARRAVPAISD